MTETKAKKPKFKYTRELMRLALDDGMTQEAIAQLCRVQQSVVSGWLKGKTRAFEHQVAELKKRYGHRLNRTTSRVYLVTEKTVTDTRWEDTERARLLLAVQGRLPPFHDQESVEPEVVEPEAVPTKPKTARMAVKRGHVAPARWQDAAKRREQARKKLQQDILPGESTEASINDLVEVDRAEFEKARHTEKLVEVEGPIVLRYTFVRHKAAYRHRTLELERLPIGRWLVHHQPNGKFVLVQQERRTLTGKALWRWRNILVTAAEDLKKLADEPYVECADDAARWLSAIHGPMDAAALLEHCETYFRAPHTLHGPHDDATLPFLLRKMLVEHGHEVPGVARIVASD
jgi:transcriptional regulator with XRE-family HTH domain